MARTIRNSKLDTPTARAKLPVSKTIHWVPITQGRSLGYRKGAKAGVWVAKLVKGGKPIEHRLGLADDAIEANGSVILSYQQAMEAARQWFTAQEKGSAPVSLTVGEACRRYVAYLNAEAATAKDAEQRIAKHVLPKLGERLVAELTLTELTAWRDGLIRRDANDPDMERRSKDTANRLLNYLKAALNKLTQDKANHITDDSAWRFLKPFEKVGKVRKVFLDNDQICRFLNASEGSFRLLATAALLTGARPGELKNMRAQDFHRDTGSVFVRAAKGGEKTGERDVVLTAEGVAFFDRLVAGKHPDAPIFLRDDGSQWGKDDHHRPMRVAALTAKLPDDTCFYSLRHTYASQSLMAGINLQLLAENMGTSVKMIEHHYGKFSRAARRQQIEASAIKLGLAADNVVPLRTA